ncbi:MAG: hypothetical protein C0469_03605 [Cyanobacteria bacterium DS2.3.42]|nr:hypothetical protein [Cyanobacteria bacterium DS2.3.42]
MSGPQLDRSVTPHSMHANARKEDNTKGSLLKSLLVALIIPEYMTLNGAGRLSILDLVHRTEITLASANTQEHHNRKDYK